jgi:hypothetical protein
MLLKSNRNSAESLPCQSAECRFQFIWEEIKVLFTATSDCLFAKEMLSNVAKEAIGE